MLGNASFQSHMIMYSASKQALLISSQPQVKSGEAEGLFLDYVIVIYSLRHRKIIDDFFRSHP